MHPDLSFDQAPPISVPYRFFLTAPWFGVAAGLLLAWHGETIFASRWMPQTLALVHLFTAGFMLQAMCGAMLQFVPVAAGGNVARPLLVARLAHPALTIATVLLVSAFLSGTAGLFLAALILFLLGGGVFIVALAGALFKVKVSSPTLVALKLALVALSVTLALGIALAAALGHGWPLPMLELTDSHAAFGLGGWGLTLLLGVSAYVVPMFQLTPPYPARFLHQMPWWVLLAVLLSLLPLFGGPAASGPAFLFLLLLAAGYAAMTLRLQMLRRRRVTDPTFWFFRGAMIATLLAVAGALARAVLPEAADAPLLFATATLILEAFVSAINGMLYKIIPFINWLHLQRLTQQHCAPGSLPPNMRLMIPESRMRLQMRLHFVAFAVIVAASGWPPLVVPGGLLFAASSAWLGANLVNGVRQYREYQRRILLS